MKFSRDAAIPRIPAPHLLKQGQLQLAGASFRDQSRVYITSVRMGTSTSSGPTGTPQNMYRLHRLPEFVTYGAW